MSRMVAAGLRLAMPGARMGLRSCKSQLGRAFLGERAGVQRGGYGLVGAAGRDTVWGNRRAYSAPAGLAKPEVEGRIIDLLKNFDKVKDATQLTSTSHFANDLGLDSLDTVEVVMAIEEEFSIEIPDKEADAILSTVEYILAQPDAH